jgi:ABC-type branched-subunit amino acid transport system substrate-binding protein
MGNWNEGEIKDMKASLELSYDAIYIPGFYDKVGLILPQLAFYNIEDVVLLGSRGWNSPELVKLAGNYLSESVFLDGFFADADEPEVQEFVSAYQQTFGEAPGIYSAQAYDATAIFIQAVHTGATNRKKMLQALGSVRDFSGASGITTILEDGDSEKKLFVLTVRDKQIVLAHPVAQTLKADPGPAEITAP